jgi:mevalonate kinase
MRHLSVLNSLSLRENQTKRLVQAGLRKDGIKFSGANQGDCTLLLTRPVRAI